MTRLAGKVALISGAARGQGAAEARAFVAEGCRVVIGDVLGEPGRALAEELGPAARFADLDVRTPESWAAAVALAETEFGGLDVLVNNAGILRFSMIENMPLAQFQDVLAVNAQGCFLGMQAALDPLRRRGGGSIVNISSTSGLAGGAGLAAYTASKFAVRGMTKCAALEFGVYGIRVNAVFPGGVDTPMIQGLIGGDVDAGYREQPIARAGRPDEVAKLVTFLACDDSSYCTGSEFSVDGGALIGPESWSRDMLALARMADTQRTRPT